MDPNTLIARLGGPTIFPPQYLSKRGSIQYRLLVLLSDFKWHSAREIRVVVDNLEPMRHLRELRKIPGIFILKKRQTGSHIQSKFLYKLSYTPK